MSPKYISDQKKHTQRAILLLLITILIVGLVSLAIDWNGSNSNNSNTTLPNNSSSTQATSTQVSTTSEQTTTPPISPILPPIDNPQPISTPTTSIPTSSAPIITPASSSLNYQFGIATDDLMAVSDPGEELSDITSLGIGWIRVDLPWSGVQPTDSAHYNWGFFDTIVAAANARNLKILAILHYTPAWARPAGCYSYNCAPSNPANFAAFAKAAAQRYGQEGITAWEIWNEPNLTESWQPMPSPAAYTTLLQDTYAAIKSVEPSSTVITGGLGPSATSNGNIAPLDFLTDVYADGGKNYFDAVGDHPYSFPALPLNYQPWNAWSQMASTPESIRGIMLANGDAAKKVWLTEYGAPTGGPGPLATDGSLANFSGMPDHVTEALQAQMLSEAVTSVEQLPWAGPFFWYSYQDLGTSTITNENFFGLLRYDGTPKPAYTTLKNLIEPTN